MDHTGSKKNAIFKVKWKSGDSSWLPYYQVSHLDALNTYLELLGVPDISQLPKGTEKPPLNDEQVFVDEDEAFLGAIGFLTYKEEPNSPSPPASSTLKFFSFISHILLTITSSICLIILNTFFSSPKMPVHKFCAEIDHPIITCLKPYCILLQDSTNLLVRIRCGASQVIKFIEHDQYLHAHGADPTDEPLGYTEFVALFNRHASGEAHFSTYDVTAGNYIITEEPIKLEFFMYPQPIPQNPPAPVAMPIVAPPLPPIAPLTPVNPANLAVPFDLNNNAITNFLSEPLQQACMLHLTLGATDHLDHNCNFYQKCKAANATCNTVKQNPHIMANGNVKKTRAPSNPNAIASSSTISWGSSSSKEYQFVNYDMIDNS
ncbi:hypothetical protein BDQ17DRAFT_1420311 [Cyathus striatus]|nr:hypothetical protein BDQ17DRAFT_1420311 [Cyathus striatus]